MGGAPVKESSMTRSRASSIGLLEKSKEVDGMLTEEIRALLKEIKAFKDEISGDSKYVVDYAREFNDIHEISAPVEAVYNARR
jgi:hypothetical protein